MTKNKNNQHGIPILITTGFLAIAFSFIFGVFVGNVVPGTATSAPDSLSGWVGAIATVAIGVLTFVLAVETWRLRATQTAQIAELTRESVRPNVGVELVGSHVGMNFMDVKVSNFGKGVAKNIIFCFLDKQGNPASLETTPIMKVFHKLTMFRRGIQSMGINQELKSFVFSFYDLERDIGAGVFTPFVNIAITFEDIHGYEYQNAFVVDFSQYEGISTLGGDSLHELASEAKKIREHLGKIGEKNNRVSVDIFNSDDREAEAEAWRLEREAYQTQRDTEIR